MNDEVGKPINLLDHMIGMRVIDCSVDSSNDDLLIRLNRAHFAFFCEYEIYPKSAHLSDLVGATLERIDDGSKSMCFKFDSGLSVKFSWDECRNVEAFAGSIETDDGQELSISEPA